MNEERAGLLMVICTDCKCTSKSVYNKIKATIVPSLNVDDHCHGILLFFIFWDRMCIVHLVDMTYSDLMIQVIIIVNLCIQYGYCCEVMIQITTIVHLLLIGHIYCSDFMLVFSFNSKDLVKKEDTTKCI